MRFSGPDLPLADEMARIAKRDGTDFSNLMVDLARAHVQAHANGNAVIPLTKFADNPHLLALPTMGEVLTLGFFSKLSDDELEVLIRAAKGRYQEVFQEAKRRGWWVAENGQYERRRKH